MSNELSELILTIDTREQNQRRIDTLKTWFEFHNGIVERTKLDLCDYKIEGTYREKEINLGIEAKSIGDFSTSFEDLPDKLARAYNLYTDVGLFIEVGNYTFIPELDDFHSNIVTVVNPKDNVSVSVPLAVLENLIESLQVDGIHVRQLRSEYHFPYALANLLIYISNPVHDGLQIKTKDYRYEYLNVLAKMPGVGYKTALKISDKFMNLHYLASSSLEDIQEAVGKKTGIKLDAFLRHKNYNDKSAEVLPPHISISSAPISSHTSETLLSTPKSLDDPRSQNTESPHSQIPSSGDINNDELFGVPPSSWEKGYKEVTPRTVIVRDKMNLRGLLTEYLETPHTLQEIQDAHENFQKGYVWEMVMRMNKEREITEFDNKTFVLNPKVK